MRPEDQLLEFCKDYVKTKEASSASMGGSPNVY